MKMWKEFFQDINGAGSMTRLILFGTFVFASLMMIVLTAQGKMSEAYMTMYLAFPAGVYMQSKYQDGKDAKAGVTQQPPP